MRVTMGVTEIGPVTNPKLIRHKLGIVPRGEVDFVDRGETIVVEPRDRTANTEEISNFSWHGPSRFEGRSIPAGWTERLTSIG